MEWQNAIAIAIIGSVAGFLSGLLGIGGPIIIISALVLFLGYSQQLAQGTALMMMSFPIGALAAYQYYQKGMVDVKAALIMAVCFFVGGYIGAKFATNLPHEILRKAFAVMLVLIAFKMWFQK